MFLSSDLCTVYYVWVKVTVLNTTLHLLLPHPLMQYEDKSEKQRSKG